MLFKLKTKTISTKTQIYLYSHPSFFLQIWLYQLLLIHKLKITLIAPNPDSLIQNPQWQFFTTHPNLKILSSNHLTQKPAKADFFIDLSFISLFENLNHNLNHHVDTGFGIINRLSFAYQAQSKFVLLFPLIRNLHPESSLFYQIQHHINFLSHYTKTYQLPYKIIQLPDYLNPALSTFSGHNLLTQTLLFFLHQKPIPFHPQTPLFIADLNPTLQLIEKLSFGFNPQPITSISLPSITLNDFLTSLSQTTNLPDPVFVSKNPIKPSPLWLTTPQTSLSIPPLNQQSDFKKLALTLPQLASHSKLPPPKPLTPTHPAPNPDSLTLSSAPPSLPSSIKSQPPSPKRPRLPSFNFSFKNKLLPFQLPFTSKTLALFITLWFLTILTPLVLLLVNIALGLNYLDRNLPNTPPDQIIKHSQQAATSLKRAKSINQFLSPVFSVLGLAATTDNLNEILNFFILISQTNQNLAQLPTTTDQFLDYVFDRRDNLKSFSYYYSRLSQQNSQTFTLVNQALALYQDTLQSYNQIQTFKIGPRLTRTYQILKSTHQKLQTNQKIITQLPLILGYDKRQEYLVLLFDNNELRPSGGLIPAYALLTFENGQLIDFQVNDINVLDNQLKGKISPPQPLQTYLGQINWNIKDAAWYPAFTDTARQVVWFYSKSMGQEIDGVIGLDLNFFQQTARSLGPFYLPDINLTLDDKNLLKRAFLWGDLETGTQNEIFTSLLKSFFLKLKTLKTTQSPNFLSDLTALADQKSLRFYFNHTQLQATFNQLRWDGPADFPTCQNDCLLIGGLLTQANLGANRVNYLIQQRLSLNLTVKNNELIQTISLYTKNPSTSPKWPGGDYKDYLTLYVPNTWQLEEVRLADKILDLDQISIATQSQTLSYSLFQIVPFGQSQTLTFAFSTPLNSPLKQLDTVFALIKQAGLKNLDVVFEITPPKNQKLKLISPKTWQKHNLSALYQQKLDKDIIIPVRLKLK